MAEPVTAVAIGGKVRIEFNGPLGGVTQRDLTPEQADALWNAIAEAELVALEQRVRARRRVTEGARGGWVNAPAQGRHAVDAGMALAESTAAALNRLAPIGDRLRMAAAERVCAGRAAPGPGDPYPAPDYHHPDDDDDD